MRRTRGHSPSTVLSRVGPVLASFRGFMLLSESGLLTVSDLCISTQVCPDYGRSFIYCPPSFVSHAFVRHLVFYCIVYLYTGHPAIIITMTSSSGNAGAATRPLKGSGEVIGLYCCRDVQSSQAFDMWHITSAFWRGIGAIR